MVLIQGAGGHASQCVFVVNILRLKIQTRSSLNLTKCLCTYKALFPKVSFCCHSRNAGRVSPNNRTSFVQPLTFCWISRTSFNGESKVTPKVALKDTMSSPGRVTGSFGDRYKLPFNGSSAALQSLKLKPYKSTLLCEQNKNHYYYYQAISGNCWGINNFLFKRKTIIV